MAKIVLGVDDMITFFSFAECCEVRQCVSESALYSETEITYPKCEEPILFRSSNGLWYRAGEMVFT